MNLPAKIRKRNKNQFLSVNDEYIVNIGMTEASTVTSGYSRGPDRDNANIIIVKEGNNNGNDQESKH